MLQFNSTSTYWESIDFNRRKHLRTINTRKKVINHNTTQKSAKNHLSLPNKEDKKCLMPTVRKLTLWKSFFTQLTPLPLSVAWRRLDKSSNSCKTRSLLWCLKPFSALIRDSFKTNTRQLETTISTFTLNQRSTRRGTKILKSTGTRGAKRSWPSSLRSTRKQSTLAMDLS